MKLPRALLAAGLAMAVACSFAAEKSAKEKTPGDLAAEAYQKLRDDKDAGYTGPRLLKVLAAGMDYLCTYPTHSRASSVITSLATFGNGMSGKKLAPMRDYWLSQLNYEILNRRTAPGTTDEAKLVLAALDASTKCAMARNSPSPATVGDFRQKIDQLAEMEGSAKFVLSQEREYLLLVWEINPKAGEAQATKLLEHRDKKIAAMAREELNLMEVRRAPMSLKFTSLNNGKEVDLAKLRGKPVLLFFWDASEASEKEVPTLDDVFSELEYAFNVVTICLVPEAEKDAAMKFIKAKHISWPVYFDGKGKDNELAQKLNVKAPACFMLDKNGNLASVALKANKVKGEVQKLGDVKK